MTAALAPRCTTTAARIACACVAALCIAQCCAASSLSQSIDASTGFIDVDRAKYLSKHDIVFNHPISNPVYGSTVGNGRVGAMVWNKDGLDMQISGVDASEETAFSAGLVHLYTAPAMDNSFANFQQRLSLHDGVLTTKYDADRTVTVMGAADSEVIGIHVSDARTAVAQVTLDLSIWDVSKLSGGDVPDMETWRSVATHAAAKWVGLSRGQHDPNHFGYTLAATVQGAAFVTRSVDANTTRLIITPSSSYTIWIACASRLNAPGHDSVRQAQALLSAVQSDGYAKTLTKYQDWWHAFWRKSFVQYSSSTPGGDYLENLYYLYTYIIAAASYANYPMHFVNADFSAVGDANSTKWSVAYWYWNERDVYNSFLSSNHPEMLHVLDHLYARNFPALMAHTRLRFGVAGVRVPETMGWDASARFTDGNGWTDGIFSTGAEIAANMYAEYAYTNDARYLQMTAYPFMKEVARFYSNKLVRNPDTGKYAMEKSNAHETYWGVANAITDLAAIRSLFPLAVRTSETLGVDTDERAQWRTILDNLTPYPVAEDGSYYAAHGPPAAQNHNAENVACELIWPYGVTGIGAPDFQMALETWRKRPYPYSNIWANDAIQAARLGLGEDVQQGLKIMTERYQAYPNGLTNDGAGAFEDLGTLLSAINESLLQSYNDKIRVFAALPDDPDFVSSFTLLARGGFLVSSEYENRDIKYVALTSLYGNRLTLENPWRHERVRVRRAGDGVTLLTTMNDEFTFETTPKVVYLIERTARPLSSFKHRQLTGTANDDAKQLAGSSATLGSYR